MAAFLPLTFLSPVLLFLVAAAATMRPGRRPGAYPRLCEAVAMTALLLGLGGLAQYLVSGPSALVLFGGMFELSLHSGPVSVALTLLVSFIGWIVVRYSRTYLDGETREGTFHGLLLATLGAVLLVIQSGSLLMLAAGTIGVGLALKPLLLFYADRPQARRAATKFALVWHAGDIALLAAAILLTASLGTGNLSAIAGGIGAQEAGFPVSLAIALLVLAAVLKSAAFPLHGWLTEVMEAPTPVSALLHAGVVNSGGVVLLLTADLVQSSAGAMGALVMIGGFTALFGAAVMLTQSAVKTALAWSTVSQMGFLLLQCGLGLWPLALLHIIAHSLYKAHAFLSSGGAVAAVASLRRPGPVAVPGLSVVLRSFALALLLYGGIAALFTLVAGTKSPQALALGAILIFGVAYLVAQGLADRAPADLTRRTVLAAIGAAIAYFSFQAGANVLWGSVLPAAPAPAPLEWGLIVLAILSFGLVAFAQALFPLWAHHPATAGLRVHLANGLYLNALLDRAIGGFRTPGTN